MIKVYFFILAIFLQSLYAERSMFGAGDLESSSPYGLTSAEKVIVKNKTIVKKNEKKIKKVDTLIRDINERVDGIESLLEGEGSKLNKNAIDLRKYKSKSKIKEQEYTSKLLDLTGQIKEQSSLIDTNTKNILLLKESIDSIVKLVNEINSKYITKKEFNNLISLLDKQDKKKSIKKKTKTKTKKQTKSNKTLMKEVRVLFKKDHFTKAIPILEHLIEKRHRPAECNYYMGEINYYRKKYKNALHYFKISMTLYDKAKYIPKLLLHSAISFEKLGDTENSQNFYNTLVDIYPDTKEAAKASKKIQ